MQWICVLSCKLICNWLLELLTSVRNCQTLLGVLKLPDTFYRANLRRNLRSEICEWIDFGYSRFISAVNAQFSIFPRTPKIWDRTNRPIFRRLESSVRSSHSGCGIQVPLSRRELSNHVAVDTPCLCANHVRRRLWAWIRTGACSGWRWYQIRNPRCRP